MKENFTLDQIRRFALAVVVIGLIVSISGAVRTGSIILSLGAILNLKLSAILN